MTDPDSEELLRSTTRTFEKVLRAVLDGDKAAARQVLRGSSGRRKAEAAVSDLVRANESVPMRHRMSELQFVADIGHVGDLLDQLARHVIGGGDSIPLDPARRKEITGLLDAGSCRLRQLTIGPHCSGTESRYLICGSSLREVATRGSRDRSATLALCSALASTLLKASCHAARAA